MTLTLSPQTETLLQEMARLLDWDAEEVANALLLEALEAARICRNELVYCEYDRTDDLFAGCDASCDRHMNERNFNKGYAE